MATKKKKNRASKPKKTVALPKGPQPFKVRRSKVHGSGAFAIRDIKKGEAVIEYVGQRITHAEADRRYAKKADDDNHTFLFTIDSKHVIDAGVDGNDARFINHSCDPNCEVYLVEKKPIIEALRAIKKGEELAYDYNLTRDSDDDQEEAEKIFACRCGSPKCRGTMLAPRKTRKAKKAKKNAAAAKKTTAGKSPRRAPKKAGKKSKRRASLR